jgi:hypothetical protein
MQKRADNIIVFSLISLYSCRLHTSRLYRWRLAPRYDALRSGVKITTAQKRFSSSNVGVGAPHDLRSASTQACMNKSFAGGVKKIDYGAVYFPRLMQLQYSCE